MEQTQKYLSFTAYQFVTDEAFISWVKFPDRKNEAFWEGFLKQHPQKAGEIEKAKRILQEMILKEEDPVAEKENLIWRNIEKGIAETGEQKSRSIVRKLYPYAAAASVILVLLAGYYFFVNPKQGEVQTAAHSQIQGTDIAPGGNKAILTLADGTQVVLDSAGNGVIALQGATKIQKEDGGLITYQADRTAGKELRYNEISTPRGGQFQIMLPDGSKVWLNSASSIRFPVEFVGDNRSVSITGEVYFEVAHNAQKPFFVSFNDVSVKVLGTHFNVDTYGDEGDIRTTLLSGSVEVGYAAQKVRISPGEQARVGLQAVDGQSGKGNIDHNLKVVKNVDVDKVMAWKDGYFSFEGEKISGIMNKISRWYDVTVIYEGEKPAGHFSGIVSRNLELSKVLYALELYGVKYKLEGKTLIIK